MYLLLQDWQMEAGLLLFVQANRSCAIHTEIVASQLLNVDIAAPTQLV